MGGEQDARERGDEGFGRIADDARGLVSPESDHRECIGCGPSQSQEDDGQGEREEPITPEEEQVPCERISSLVKLAGKKVKEKVEELQNLGHCEVVKVYVEEDGKWFEAEDFEELEEEEKCVLELKASRKLAMEDLYYGVPWNL